MKVGDKVKVKNTDHITKIARVVESGWFQLKKPHRNCCNYYGSWELKKVK